MGVELTLKDKATKFLKMGIQDRQTDSSEWKIKG